LPSHFLQSPSHSPLLTRPSSSADLKAPVDVSKRPYATAASDSLPARKEKNQIESDDIVKKLSELTITSFQLAGKPSEDPHGDSLVKEVRSHSLYPVCSALTISPSSQARKLLDPEPNGGSLKFSNTGSSRPSTEGSLILPVSTTPTTAQELTGRVPSKSLVDRAVQGHFSAVAWYIHVITRSAYQQHEDLVFEAKALNKAAPPFSLSICFAIWAVGLYGCDDSGPLYANYRKTDLAVAFIELARSALVIGRCMQNPSLDTIRVLLLVATHYCIFSPGDDGGCGIGLLALAIQSGLQVRLLSLLPFLLLQFFPTPSSFPFVLTLFSRPLYALPLPFLFWHNPDSTSSSSIFIATRTRFFLIFLSPTRKTVDVSGGRLG
jgi:hypothetical protein